MSTPRKNETMIATHPDGGELVLVGPEDLPPEVAVVIQGVDDDQVRNVLGDADAAVELAGDIRIENDADYAVIADLLTGTIKPALAEIERTFRPMQRATDAAHKEVCAQRNRHEKPLLEVETKAKSAMGDYHQEQERIVAKAEQERLEVARIEAEDLAIAEAARLESAGYTEAAEERLAAPVVPVLAAPTVEAPKAEGTSVQTKPDFRIIDERKITRAFLVPNTKKIRQVVISMGADAVELVGGIEVFAKSIVSASAR